MQKAKKAKWIVLEAVAAVLLAAVLIANFIALPYSDLIAQFLGQETFRIEEVAGGGTATNHFTSAYTSYETLQADQIELAKTVQAEGSVLLKNAGLPLAANSKITLLGMGCSPSGFLMGGGGSGTVDTSNTQNLNQIFTGAGFEVNPVLWDYYNTGAGVGTRTANQIGEQPISGMTAAELDSLAQYHDAGIVFISRAGSEGNDLVRSTTEDPNRHMLELSLNELDLLDFAVEHFDNVVVIVNATNAIELGPVVEKDVSVLWIGAGGQYGPTALPEILTGQRYPSGRLADTYVYDNLSAPATVNQGDYTFTNVEDPLTAKYYVYAEGIYVGYKYYETRYADVVLGQGNAGDYDYASTVIYPFGYGLGYTTFRHSDFSVTENANAFTASVTVTNTGDAAGKETVQIYMQSPYTDYDRQNGIEKAGVELVGFAKTAELAPGASETVTVEISRERMKTYDASGAGTYIVDAGDYYFAAGSDAHDALNNILAAQGCTRADGMTADGSADMVYKTTVDALDTGTYAAAGTGVPIVNQFESASITHYDPGFTYLSRSNWTGTWPTTYGNGSTTATEQMLADMDACDYPVIEDAVMPTMGAESPLTLSSMVGLDYGDPLWEELLDKLTADEMMALVSDGGFGTPVTPSINKPATTDKDGPAGISSTLIGGRSAFGYPVEVLFGSTWNTTLAAQMGSFIGEDALLTGVSGWYAPAANTHRTAFSGRNFEYYAEDSLLSGMMAASLIEQAQARGVVCYMKHFALNDQETNRSGACTFANEQSIREIYLRPFELAVREGGAFALMTSYNNIGVTWSGHHRNLLTNVVRGEWGFEGSFITDFMSSYVPHRSTEGAVYAGQDMYLNSAAGAFYVDGYAQNASLLQNLRRACHNILYVYANSTAMNGISESTRVVSVTPAWQYWMFTLDAVMVLLFAAVTILLVRRLRHAGDAAAVEETAEHKRRKRIILAVVLVVVLAAVIVIGINVYQFFAVRQF